MELKKSHKADLNNKRSYFFMTGAIIALLAIIGLFNWSQQEKKIEMLAQNVVTVEMEQPEITVQEDKRPPAPVKTQAVVISEMLNVVRNDKTIDQDLSIFDLDVSEIAVDNSKYGGTYTGGEGEVEEETPALFAEEMATFDGQDGQSAFSRWCQQNLTYPPLALDNGVQGTVTVSFVVEPNGKITNIKLERGTNPDLDRAALAIVGKSPDKWKPAKNNGRAVRLKIIIPIKFMFGD